MSIRQAILDEAVEAVSRGGEAALRVHDVARRVGCSVSALYVHFGSREGLAEAALVEHLRRHTEGRAEALAAQLHRAGSVTAVKRALSAHVNELCGDDQQSVHLARAELVAAARTRPSVREALVQFEASRHAQMREALIAARQRGVVRADVDVDAVAALLRSSSLAHALVLTDGMVSPTPWAKVLTRSLEAVILP
jgi:AcrR family transcriptional regulator